jgi:signal transduction histidine kinase
VTTEQQTQEQISGDLLAEMGNRLHVTMLKLTMVFGAGFAILNWFIGTPAELYAAVSLVPTCAFFLWLFHKGYRLLSKVVSLLFILTIISLISLMISQEMVAPVFFIPIIMGMLIIFPGREQKIGYSLAAFTLCLLLVLLYGDFQISTPPPRSEEKLHADRVSNIFGTAILCLLEIYFVMRASKIIQKLLAERSENLRQNNKRLTSLLKSRESMVSILSHDLRSPLTLIVSTLDLMKPGRFPPDQLEGLVEKVSNRTKNTLLMLDSLLLWSSSQSDGAAFTKGPVSLKEIKQNLQQYCEMLAAEKMLSFEINIPESGELHSSRVMIDTILRNLVSNAFKFTAKDGRIQVSAFEEDVLWVFIVEDNGRGMKPETLEKLRNGMAFSTEGTDKEKGHGLGIQIVRDFLQKLGGQISVESEEGHGACFVFTLPKN